MYQQKAYRLRIACLGPVVSSAAEEGDQAALEIQEQASADLAKMVIAVVHKLGLKGNVPCAMGGGVLIHNEAVALGLIDPACQEKIILEPVENISEPARGAVRVALRVAVPR